MNTVSDILAFNRERASRHINEPSRRWWLASLLLVALLAGLTMYTWLGDSPGPVHQAGSSSANR